MYIFRIRAFSITIVPCVSGSSQPLPHHQLRFSSPYSSPSPRFLWRGYPQRLPQGTLCYTLSAGMLCPTRRVNVSWVFKSNSPGFNNLVFHQRIISTVESWKGEEQRLLFPWWNRCAAVRFPSEPPLNVQRSTFILTTAQQHNRSRLRGSVHAACLSDPRPAPGSAAAIIVQQAADTGAGPQMHSNLLCLSLRIV